SARTERLLEECRRQSIELLKRNLTPTGIAAATPSERSARRRYTAIFGRDAAICAFGMAASGDPVLESAAVTALETLAKHQAPNGQLPKFVEAGGRDADFWYVGCIDSTLWWLIACAQLDALGRPAKLRERFAAEITRALDW